MSLSVTGVVRRTWPVLIGLAWVGIVLLVHRLGVLGAGEAAAATSAGLVLAALALARRWHHTVLQLLDRQQRQLDAYAARFAQRHVDVHEELLALRRRLDEVPRELVGPAELGQAIDQAAEHTIDRTLAGVGDLTARASTDTVQRVRKAVGGDLMRTYRQLEALHNLYAVSDTDRVMPPARDWACSPDLLLFLVDLVDRDRPQVIVECGSGLSTLWFGKALRRFDIDGTVVALEHLADHVQATRDLISRHDLDGQVEVRHAELEDYDLDGESYQWYARSSWADLGAIDLLFVDGPPAETNSHARYPALPLLGDRLSTRGCVVLDDMVRSEEQQILRQWLIDDPEYRSEPVRLEKHAAVLRRATV